MYLSPLFFTSVKATASLQTTLFDWSKVGNLYELDLLFEGVAPGWAKLKVSFSPQGLGLATGTVSDSVDLHLSYLSNMYQTFEVGDAASSNEAPDPKTDPAAYQN